MKRPIKFWQEKRIRWKFSELIVKFTLISLFMAHFPYLGNQIGTEPENSSFSIYGMGLDLRDGSAWMAARLTSSVRQMLCRAAMLRGQGCSGSKHRPTPMFSSSFSHFPTRLDGFNLQALKDKQKELNQNHPDKKEAGLEGGVRSGQRQAGREAALIVLGWSNIL